MTYVPYALDTLVRERRLPNAKHTVVPLYATQLPDLIDKPLAWSVGILPTGRSLAHSLLTASLVLASRVDERDATTVRIRVTGPRSPPGASRTSPPTQ